ncbi:MAG: carbamoyl-phosphate synthase (glutamine-hydrolyzing) large subunit [Gammaproteobacteria bacterium]|nr:carbamoyl-phosphate synthase (glutamine-hydrolyzing) large subunit [Gammaproteobacteria bacterium]NIR90086.1 carbamoyl-phosphate synthase (glutamine-hydrolyzing) large subunit [Gammaproteobacteria bacterium]NIU03290.1 carbamoyl-phosphate synthase (glutamine-hydrolyzing) large subunit [Gammaproteobacteria bacterium]NIV50784.1 carbamoyl-phosphate synthase (glutamine-hydrolyzing) large subunit [Gammaproteobacteria bacterium]NIV75370.1 carbamoyl-phosphate synthase (glutamine-hydrolyzing) large s
MYGAYLPRKPRRVLVLGSGALQIGQAGEFDYSGSQALKALKEEGIFTVLVNPNIATIQTSTEFADKIYLVDLNPEFLEQVIVKEEVDGILLSFGGQTALNCGVALHESGALSRYGIQVLGSSIETVRDTEDRRLFIERLAEIGVETARSRACESLEEARDAASTLGFPVMLRGAFALGGRGSSIVQTPAELDDALRRAFSGGVRQVLVEECLRGWKEIEYEVVRDGRDNCITVCNMENFDPMGIHTGESIVVAPSQTLDDEDYQGLRSISIRTIRHLKVLGECNIQFALDPKSRDYRVIEVNARLSRSSALASKATGYPLAYVAAKLALGYTLPEIPNGITRRTTAFFEPALDYLVCKVPRWDLGKCSGASTCIGSEMKSVGEVMAIGRTFPEVIQKALRMLDIGVEGLDPDAFEFEDIQAELQNASPERMFAIAGALRDGVSVDAISAATGIDGWFLYGLESIVRMHDQLMNSKFPVSGKLLGEAKRLGFSDRGIEHLTKAARGTVRKDRERHEIRPHLAQIDTMAAEFPADTNYLYSTYHADRNDVEPSWRKKIMVLGSGPYRIGSSVEFDWCCVSAVQAAAEIGYETIMVNYNPETVSTDYDMCDRLVFDELSLETVLDLCEQEQPFGVVVSMGGQISNSLAVQLHEAGVNLLGTTAQSIDRAEDRQKFSRLLDELGIDQPRWSHVTDVEDASAVVERLGGFPVLVRPSYVLSGAAMNVAREPQELARILARAKDVSREYPVVVSKFEVHAREIEIDAVADEGDIVLWAVSEHIEDAGVHSGDATLVLPPQTLYIATIRRCRQITAQLARALRITGPFNVQFLAKHNAVKVIECNLRASRSFPFVSKVTGQNFAAEAMRRMLGVKRRVSNHTLDLDYVGVKAPKFSFSRIVGADPMLGVEMVSTGEVGCLGEDLHEALLHGLLATGFRFPRKGVVLSLGPVSDKYSFTDEARVIHEELGLPIYATKGTAEMLEAVGIPCVSVAKSPGDGLSALQLIDDGVVDLVINVPREYDEQGRPDGYLIRRRAVDAGIAILTDLPLARAVIEALRYKKQETLGIAPLNDYLARGASALGTM